MQGALPGDYARRLAEALEAADGGAGAQERMLGNTRHGALPGQYRRRLGEALEEGEGGEGAR